MREVVMSVLPAAEGWWVECDLPLEPTFYLSGARAEACAQDLAVRLRDIGRDVRLLVKDQRPISIERSRVPFSAELEEVPLRGLRSGS